jgi:hypothetical protein
MSMTFTAELPAKAPAALPVYRLRPPQASPRALAAVARQLGLSGASAELGLSEDWTTYFEGRWRLSVNRRSGALRFRHRDTYGVETEQAYSLAPRDSARAALAFLKRTGLVPLRDAALHRVTHLRSGTGDLRGGREEKVLDAGVIYRRQLDGVPVNGPGGFVMVNIGPDKEITGFSSLWRPVQKKQARVKLIPPEQALARFKELTARLYGDTTVTQASLGYFELGELDRQTYLEPAYCFVYEVRNRDVAHKAVEVIAAGERTFGRLKGEKRFPTPPQARRKVPAVAGEDPIGQAMAVRMGTRARAGGVAGR